MDVSVLTFFSRKLMATLALSSHENFCDCSMACCFSCLENSSSSRACCIFLEIAAKELESKSASSQPMTSGILVVFEPIVGAPHDIASSAGSPKPSCLDGKTKSVARL